MIGVDDLMEDTHWINVQDPIRQMFLAISKAIRVQAAGIRDLDTKCSNYVTHDLAQRMTKEAFDQACSKQDATQIIYQVESKAPAKDLHSVEATVQQVSEISHVVQIINLTLKKLAFPSNSKDARSNLCSKYNYS